MDPSEIPYEARKYHTNWVLDVVGGFGALLIVIGVGVSIHIWFEIDEDPLVADQITNSDVEKYSTALSGLLVAGVGLVIICLVAIMWRMDRPLIHAAGLR